MSNNPASSRPTLTNRALRTLLAIALTVPLLPAPAAAWGNNGHVYINQDAAEKIPADMPAFLRTKSAIARIVYIGPEPDRWRGPFVYALNEAQAPDHFIDLDRLPELGIKSLSDLPRGRYEFIKLVYEQRAALLNKNPSDADAANLLPERIGFQPYITMEVFDRLKEAFRDYRELKKAGQSTEAIKQDIVFYAGWLGHYVADGSMPLHTSSQYDGWNGPNPNGYTTQKGIHARFETDFVDRNITAASFADMIHVPVDHPGDAPPNAAPNAAASASGNTAANQLPGAADPFNAYLNYLADSSKQVERVYQLDKAHAFDGAGTPASQQFVKERLAAARKNY